MATGVGNIKVEPMDITWEIEEQTQIQLVADVADSLDGTYFTLATGGSETATHYVWYDGVAAADPAPAGLTAVPVAYTTGDSASTLAGLTATAIDGVSGLGAVDNGDGTVTVTADTAGLTFDTADVDTGFTMVKCQDGGTTTLGLLDGDIEVAFEQSLLDITAHQTGTTLRGQLLQGLSAEVSLTLKETDKAKLKEVFSTGGPGGTYTGASSDELFGWGSSKQGQNTFTQGRRLTMHPVRLAAGDKGDDFVFWKTYPMPESLTFSGENAEVVSVTFKAYIDENKPSGISLWAQGNWDQTDLVP